MTQAESGRSICLWTGLVVKIKNERCQKDTVKSPSSFPESICEICQRRCNLEGENIPPKVEQSAPPKYLGLRLQIVTPAFIPLIRV